MKKSIKKATMVNFVLAFFLAMAPAAANEMVKIIKEISAYLEFVDYGGLTIFAEQIPKSEYAKMMVIEVREGAQFAKEQFLELSTLN